MKTVFQLSVAKTSQFWRFVSNSMWAMMANYHFLRNFRGSCRVLPVLGAKIIGALCPTGSAARIPKDF
ncbi:MAG: hypothetical protein KDN05_08600 [Verrucomicrobiae bacterium]|nr:hypothetical protein [Verrucomicrobiae bacterium]